MNKETSWYIVLWKNWFNPQEDQRLSCIKLSSYNEEQKYKTYRPDEEFFVVTWAISETEACEKAGILFDLYKGDFNKELNYEI